MIKKLFALASVTALAGLVSAVNAAGCSSNGPTQTGADDPPSTKPADAGPKAAEAGARTGTTCAAPEPVDATKFPYTKAGVTKGACTTKEADDLSAFFGKNAPNGFKVSDWAATVSKACAKCVFSDGTGPTWTPLITKNDAIDTVDRGGCIEVLSGKEACGRAYQQLTECLVKSCLPPEQGGVGTCKTQKDFSACVQDEQTLLTGPCKGAYDQMTKQCGSNLDAYEKGCAGTNFTFEGPVKVMCITGPTKVGDAG